MVENPTHQTIYENVDENKLSEILTLPWKREITKISFSDNFNIPVDKSLDRLTSLKEIIFGRDFNQPFWTKKFLDVVVFGQNYNQTTHFDSLPKKLIFGYRFNQDIEFLIGKQNIFHLEFGYKFNQSIVPLKDIGTLEKLIFGENFNQPIDSLSENDSLEYISFGGEFNHTLEPLINNPTLKTIKLRTYEFDFKYLIRLMTDVKLAIDEMNSEKLEELYLSGYPIPIKPHQHTLIKIELCRHDLKFLRYFSRLKEIDIDLSIEEKEAIDYWINGDWWKFNEAVESYRNNGNIVDEYLNYYRILHALATENKPFSGKTYLYRGINKIIYNPEQGIITFNRFASASIVYEVALSFTSNRGQLFLLEVDENTPGINLLPYKNSEDEILFPDGTRWEFINLIEAKIPSDVKQIIHLRYVGLV